jgi:hypothetical protein
VQRERFSSGIAVSLAPQQRRKKPDFDRACVAGLKPPQTWHPGAELRTQFLAR